MIVVHLLDNTGNVSQSVTECDMEIPIQYTSPEPMIFAHLALNQSCGTPLANRHAMCLGKRVTVILAGSQTVAAHVQTVDRIGVSKQHETLISAHRASDVLLRVAVL